MNTFYFLLLVGLILSLATSVPAGDTPSQRNWVELPETVVTDKIQGGLLGQILGNLNGLPHENKYIAEPGDVREYVPSLPEGARTDDDTDIEWVYVVEMQRRGELLLSPEDITRLWKRSINRYIWCSNLYVRRLMDIGFEPPDTGNLWLNPWAEFNISGQFVCEAFGLIAPAMPQSASRIGLHYTRVSIDGEPAQTTQLFASMIALAFVEDDVEKILDQGLQTVDPDSRIREVVTDVRTWYADHPDDWRAARKLARDKYTKHDGTIRDVNGYELNTAGTVAALLYGRGDFVETLRTAFNFGWDADNTAATAATIVGVIKGRAWMESQGWILRDDYRNITRDDMPTDETITRYGERLIDLARLDVQRQGGQIENRGGKTTWRISCEKVKCVYPLTGSADARQILFQQWAPRLERGLAQPAPANTRAAYVALCLGEHEDLAKRKPDAWNKALTDLSQNKKLVKVMLDSPPHSPYCPVRQHALDAGLKLDSSQNP